MFLWGAKVHPENLIQEDLNCLRDWENYAVLGKMPHELGYADEPYHEDIEAIKTMKRWMQQREERERKKQEMKKRVEERVKKFRPGTTS